MQPQSSVVNSCKCALYAWFVLQSAFEVKLRVAGQRWSGGQSSRMIGWKVVQRSQIYTRRTSGTEAFLVFMEDFAVLEARNLYIFFPDLAHWTFNRTFVILVQDISLSSQVFSWGHSNWQSSHLFFCSDLCCWLGAVEFGKKIRKKPAKPWPWDERKCSIPDFAAEPVRSWNFTAQLAQSSGRKEKMVAINGNGDSQQILSGTKGGVLEWHFCISEDEFFLTSQGEESVFRSRKVWIQI